MSTEKRLTDREFALIAKALADPRRYGIMSQVACAQGTLACSALSSASDVSAATISHHIKELETAGLIEIKREGKFAHLTFKPETLEAYLAQLSANLKIRP